MLSSASGERRAELASFLRSRRARLSPADVGLLSGLRRRTPGLRREEVAQLAGVGVTWYTWLEQGRPINVSADVLDAVATVLRLNQAEHAHLYRLAEMPEVPAKDLCPGALPPHTQGVLDAFADNPACVYSGKYDLLAWNRPYGALFPGLADEGAERNVLWHCFTAPEARNPLGSPELLCHMVATARSAYADHVGEPEWTLWIQRLSAASPAFATMWATNTVSEPMPTIKEFRCNQFGPFRAYTASFAIAGTPEARMVVYLPVEAEDRALLDRLIQIDTQRRSALV
jgi:transcriptional regulator with XRE-family HTH domain